MSHEHRQLAVAEHIRTEIRNNIVINVLLNASIAYAMLRGVTQIDAWGEHGYGKDLILTAFLLSALLGGIFIVLHRRKRDRMEFALQGDEGQTLARIMPYNPWLAATLLGTVAAVVAAPFLLGIFILLGIELLTPTAYAIIKGIWAGALAAVVVPIAITQGLRKAPQ